MLKPYSKRNTKKKLKPCNSFNMRKIGLTLIYYKDSHIISIPSLLSKEIFSDMI